MGKKIEDKPKSIDIYFGFAHINKQKLRHKQYEDRYA